MPTEKGDKQALTIWIDKDLAARIERLAEKGEITRSKLISNILEVVVPDIEKMDKVGVWAMARIFRDIGEWLNKRHEKKKRIKDSEENI